MEGGNAWKVLMYLLDLFNYGPLMSYLCPTYVGRKRKHSAQIIKQTHTTTHKHARLIEKTICIIDGCSLDFSFTCGEVGDWCNVCLIILHSA